MKGRIQNIVVLLGMIVLCFGVLGGCSDDDDNNPATSAIESRDPSYGFLLNSTPYRIALDFGQQNEFQTTLEPGELMSINMNTDRTHLVHAVVLNGNDRAIADYVNSFFIDKFALDNQLRDFICSWYVEFRSESGFYNRFGS